MAWYDEKAMDLLTNDFNDLFVVFREVTTVHQSIPQFTDFADFCGDGDPIVIFEDAGKWELGSQCFFPPATLSATWIRWGRQRQAELRLYQFIDLLHNFPQHFEIHVVQRVHWQAIMELALRFLLQTLLCRRGPRSVELIADNDGLPPIGTESLEHDRDDQLAQGVL